MKRLLLGVLAAGVCGGGCQANRSAVDPFSGRTTVPPPATGTMGGRCRSLLPTTNFAGLSDAGLTGLPAADLTRLSGANLAGLPGATAPGYPPPTVPGYPPPTAPGYPAPTPAPAAAPLRPIPQSQTGTFTPPTTPLAAAAATTTLAYGTTLMPATPRVAPTGFCRRRVACPQRGPRPRRVLQRRLVDGRRRVPRRWRGLARHLIMGRHGGLFPRLVRLRRWGRLRRPALLQRARRCRVAGWDCGARVIPGVRAVCLARIAFVARLRAAERLEHRGETGGGRANGSPEAVPAAAVVAAGPTRRGDGCSGGVAAWQSAGFGSEHHSHSGQRGRTAGIDRGWGDGHDCRGPAAARHSRPAQGAGPPRVHGFAGLRSGVPRLDTSSAVLGGPRGGSCPPARLCRIIGPWAAAKRPSFLPAAG